MAKVMYVVSGIMVVLIILIGILFVFGDEVLRTIDIAIYSGDSLYQENIISDAETDEIVGVGDVDEFEIGGGSDVGEQNSEEVADASSCGVQQIQYSLKDFRESVECTDTGVNGCTRLVVSCSMEVYSFENGVGIFGIRYALVDSDDAELDFELIEKEVGYDVPVIFSTEFVMSDILGVDEDLTCPFTMETVPRKEVCN